MTNQLQSWIGRGAFLVALAFIVPLNVFGQPAVTEENPFASNIAAATTAATNLKNEYTQMSEELRWEHEDGSLADDLVQAKAYYDGIISDFEHAAQAWSNGNDVEARALRSAAQAAMQSKDAWRKRMFEFRRAQSNAAPTQQWYMEIASVAREGALPELCNLVEGKKAASEAWRDVAEATVPGASPQRIDELKEKAHAAMGEADIALWRFFWSNERAGMFASDQRVTKEDVEAPLSRLIALQDELSALRRRQIEHERKVRQVQMDMTQAQSELVKAFWAIREAKARAASAAAAGE